MITDAQLRIPKSTLSWRSFALRASLPLGFAITCTILALLGLLYLNQNSQLTTLIYEVQSLSAERRELQQANAALEYEIATLQSLSRIREQALRLGLTETAQIELLAVAQPGTPQVAQSRLADRPTLAALFALSTEQGDSWDTVREWGGQLWLQFTRWVTMTDASR